MPAKIGLYYCKVGVRKAIYFLHDMELDRHSMGTFYASRFISFYTNSAKPLRLINRRYSAAVFLRPLYIRAVNCSGVRWRVVRKML